MVLKVGTVAPPFEARDQHGNVVHSDDFEGRRFVLYFYPKDETPVCTREACAFQEGAEAFKDLDVPIIGVSHDSVRSHARFAEKHGLTFSLLADTERKIIDAYDARGLLGRTTRVTYIIGPGRKVEAVHRAELSGRGHVEWARGELGRLQTAV